MALKDVYVVSVPVSDPERAKTFYVETLGFEVVADMPMGENQRWVQIALPGGVTSLTLVTWFPTMPAGSLQGLVLTTEDVRSERERLEALGVTFTSEIQSAPWATFTTFADPDGNGIVLQQNAQPSDAQ